MSSFILKYIIGVQMSRFWKTLFKVNGWTTGWVRVTGNLNKGLEPDPSKTTPAQQHFVTVLDFH